MFFSFKYNFFLFLNTIRRCRVLVFLFKRFVLTKRNVGNFKYFFFFSQNYRLKRLFFFKKKNLFKLFSLLRVGIGHRYLVLDNFFFNFSCSFFTINNNNFFFKKTVYLRNFFVKGSRFFFCKNLFKKYFFKNFYFLKNNKEADLNFKKFSKNINISFLNLLKTKLVNNHIFNHYYVESFILCSFWMRLEHIFLKKKKYTDALEERRRLRQYAYKLWSMNYISFFFIFLNKFFYFLNSERNILFIKDIFVFCKKKGTRFKKLRYIIDFGWSIKKKNPIFKFILNNIFFESNENNHYDPFRLFFCSIYFKIKNKKLKKISLGFYFSWTKKIYLTIINRVIPSDYLDARNKMLLKNIVIVYLIEILYELPSFLYQFREDRQKLEVDNEYRSFIFFKKSLYFKPVVLLSNLLKSFYIRYVIYSERLFDKKIKEKIFVLYKKEMSSCELVLFKKIDIYCFLKKKDSGDQSKLKLPESTMINFFSEFKNLRVKSIVWGKKDYSFIKINKDFKWDFFKKNTLIYDVEHILSIQNSNKKSFQNLTEINNYDYNIITHLVEIEYHKVYDLFFLYTRFNDNIYDKDFDPHYYFLENISYYFKVRQLTPPYTGAELTEYEFKGIQRKIEKNYGDQRYIEVLNEHAQKYLDLISY